MIILYPLKRVTQKDESKSRITFELSSVHLMSIFRYTKSTNDNEEL